MSKRGVAIVVVGMAWFTTAFAVAFFTDGEMSWEELARVALALPLVVLAFGLVLVVWFFALAFLAVFVFYSGKWVFEYLARARWLRRLRS